MNQPRLKNELPKKNFGKKIYIISIVLSFLLIVGGLISITTTAPSLGADIGGGLAVMLGGFIFACVSIIAVVHTLIKLVVKRIKYAKNKTR